MNAQDYMHCSSEAPRVASETSGPQWHMASVNQQPWTAANSQVEWKPANTGFSSETSSPKSWCSSSSSANYRPEDDDDIVIKVKDEDLVNISVRELNQKMQGYDRKYISAMKQKRRTLKNRTYALNCRVRRLQTQLQLEAENNMLKNENGYLRQLLHDAQQKAQYFEQMCSTMPHPNQMYHTDAAPSNTYWTDPNSAKLLPNNTVPHCKD